MKKPTYEELLRERDEAIVARRVAERREARLVDALKTVDFWLDEWGSGYCRVPAAHQDADLVAKASKDAGDALRGRIARLERQNRRFLDVLDEIARVKRAGIEANDSDEDWIAFWVNRCHTYERLAREVLDEM